MIRATTGPELHAALQGVRDAGGAIGFVPTMGALHHGHASLIETARRQCEAVVVSIFVNPRQFGPGEDFTNYPRPIEADLALCSDLDVDVAFVPTVEVMYPAGSETVVRVPELSRHLCGAARQGHFDGVATVVARLFGLVRPHRAYFGEKDHQQLKIIERMTGDLAIGVDIVPCPTVRESDGLAVSSRNAYLGNSERKQAASLHSAMMSALTAVRSGERSVTLLVDMIRREITAAGPCDIDYISIVDSETLADIDTIGGHARICLAVRIGSARLIDNVAVDAPDASG